jgi:UDP-N-acetyl-D-glucosamine/UDP-N-acetyl-D-galactosamine dehydrogenase
MKLDETISVVGLGYVGLPVAVAFARKYTTIGYDIKTQRIEDLKKGTDATGEVEPDELAKSNIQFTSDPETLKEATFHIITVPTPIDAAHRPELSALFSASKIVGKALKKNDVVVYESTVYPGLTEEDCIPILEEYSGLKSGIDFKVGYSPERVNPGDKAHRLEDIQKVVSGQDKEALERIAWVYESVITAGVFRAQSIKVAEAAKVIENTQRDLNVALVNELALIFDRMGIATKDVLSAARTKWNFLPFEPGLVGGHCIGVDPYYLTHKAESLGYIPQVILAGRRVNDDMGKFVAQRTIKQMALAGLPLRGSTATVLGVTFKENCPDIRNSRVFDIITELQSYGIEVQIADPMAAEGEVMTESKITLTKYENLKPAHAIIVSVAHSEYKALTPEKLQKILVPGGIVIDVKRVFEKGPLNELGIQHWSL